MENLTKLVTELENNIQHLEKINSKVSTSTVGWQIEHTLLVLIRVIEAMEKSDPKDYQWTFNLKRLIVFTTGKIPRGKATAPKQVQPQNIITIETLTNTVALAKNKLAALQNINPHSFFAHHIFGKLTLKQTIKFLEIHTLHHLKIISDITK
jgi:hypothetical protein